MEGSQRDLSFRGEILETAEGADGVAWAAMEAGGQLKKVYIKHPTLGPNDVRIKVLYCGICQSDVTVSNGKTAFNTYPMIPGHEIIGTIYALGTDVTEFKEGDLVGVGPLRGCCQNCSYCKDGKEHLCETMYMYVTISPWFGGFATSVQLPTTYTFKIPSEISPEMAPPLMCAGCTVFAPLLKYGKNAKKVAIMGIGGLGHLAIQYASKMGFTTYALSTSESKRESALKLGAHEFVITTDPEQMKKFQAEKIDLILNTTTISEVDNYMRALKKGSGVMVQIGLSHDKDIKLSVGEILVNEWVFTGSCCSSISDMKTMLEFSGKNDVKPISEVYDFEDMQKAFDRTASGKANLRVIVDYTSFKWEK